MTRPLKYLSVCSGIEAATQAWHRLGWEPVAFSEIEPFPCAVLAHHYPDVPNWGDMTKFEEWADADVDVLAGGTPCQSFSVAGLRRGLADPRGNLMLTYLAIAARYRARWLVWENVPGVLSSNGGRDFGAFVGALGQLGYGFAYRVLDAEYVRTRRFGFAVPQRRRRVFLVGYLGDWRRAAAVLFDSESLSGNSPPRREAGKKAASAIGVRATGGGGFGAQFECDGGMIALAHGQSGAEIAEGFSPTLTCNHEAPIIARTLLGKGNDSHAADMGTYVAHSLRGEGFDASEDGTGRGTPIVPVAIQERAVSENPDTGPAGAGFRHDGAAYTLEARSTAQAVAFDCKGTDVQFTEDGSHPTLRSMGHHNSHQNAGGHAAVALPWAVRRLTPRECERLMGFPDDFTKIPYRGKPADQCPDGPRYKALGNSWAVNAAEWVGERIAFVEALNNI